VYAFFLQVIVERMRSKRAVVSLRTIFQNPFTKGRSKLRYWAVQRVTNNGTDITIVTAEDDKDLVLDVRSAKQFQRGGSPVHQS